MQMSGKGITVCSSLLAAHITVFRDGSLRFWVSCSLNMKAFLCTNMTVTKNPSTRRYNPEDLNTEIPHFGNLESRMPIIYPVSLSVGSR